MIEADRDTAVETGLGTQAVRDAADRRERETRAETRLHVVGRWVRGQAVVRIDRHQRRIDESKPVDVVVERERPARTGPRFDRDADGGGRTPVLLLVALVRAVDAPARALEQRARAGETQGREELEVAVRRADVRVTRAEIETDRERVGMEADVVGARRLDRSRTR